MSSLFCSLALSSSFSKDYSLLLGLEDPFWDLSLLPEESLSFTFLLELLLAGFLDPMLTGRVYSSSSFLDELFLRLVTSSPYLFFLAGSTEFSFSLKVRVFSE
jgi:hypothetical protein